MSDIQSVSFSVNTKMGRYIVSGNKNGISITRDSNLFRDEYVITRRGDDVSTCNYKTSGKKVEKRESELVFTGGENAVEESAREALLVLYGLVEGNCNPDDATSVKVMIALSLLNQIVHNI